MAATALAGSCSKFSAEIKVKTCFLGNAPVFQRASFNEQSLMESCVCLEPSSNAE
jgi:hypothetical protein